jgi:hypothetical protein
MRAFGVDPKEHRGFGKPVKADQIKWKDEATTHFESDGTVIIEKKEHPAVYPLPYYNFRWETKDGVPHAYCEVEVSGITANVTLFYFAGPHAIYLRPKRYLEMLGLPENTVLVRRRATQPITYETVE